MRIDYYICYYVMDEFTVYTADNQVLAEGCIEKNKVIRWYSSNDYEYQLFCID